MYHLSCPVLQVKAPFGHQSDSFYFVDNTLIMHNKAKFQVRSLLFWPCGLGGYYLWASVLVDCCCPAVLLVDNTVIMHNKAKFQVRGACGIC